MRRAFPAGYFVAFTELCIWMQDKQQVSHRTGCRTAHPTFRPLDRSTLRADRSAQGQTGLRVDLVAHFGF